MEFKVCRQSGEEGMEKAVEEAIKQIEDRRYEVSLGERGFYNITKMVFAFSGKQVKMKVY